jgi:hypothetical protein
LDKKLLRSVLSLEYLGRLDEEDYDWVLKTLEIFFSILILLEAFPDQRGKPISLSSPLKPEI